MAVQVLTRVRSSLSVALGVIASTFVTSSCATLDDIPDGCGNHVLDGEEDCDLDTGDASAGAPLCGAPDSEHECKFVWDADHPCPAGHVTSTDGRCRLPSESFSLVAASTDLLGANPQLADFDGDGQRELVVEQYGGATSHAIYGFQGTESFRAFGLLSYGTPAIGDLSEDGIDDVALSVATSFGGEPGVGMGEDTVSQEEGIQSGVSVLRSRDGSFDLKLYAKVNTLLVYALAPGWAFPGGDDDQDLDFLTTLFIDSSATTLCAMPGGDGGCDQVLTFAAALDNEAPLHTSHNRDRFLLSQDGGNLIYLFERGKTDVFRLQLDAGGPATLVGGAFLADVDGDQLDDLVAVGRRGDTHALHVLSGAVAWQDDGASIIPVPEWATDEPVPEHLGPRKTTTGITCSVAEPCTLPEVCELTGMRPGQCVLNESVLLPDGFGNGDLTAPQLAQAADLNGDGASDLVVGRFALLSRSSAQLPPNPSISDRFRIARIASSDPLALAVGDMNADGLDDIAAATGDQTVTVSWGGSQVPLVTIEKQSDGPVTLLALTDFDGDGASDLLYSAFVLPDAEEITPVDCREAFQLAIAFGRANALPEDPQSLAFLPFVYQLIGGRFRGKPDGFGDFAFSAACPPDDGSFPSETANGTLLGNSDRVISIPFVVDLDGGSSYPLLPTHILARQVATSSKDDPKAPHTDLVVLGSNDGVTLRGVVLRSWGDAELDMGEATELVMPAPADWGYPISDVDAAEDRVLVAQVLAAESVSVRARLQSVDAQPAVSFEPDLPDLDLALDPNVEWAMPFVRVRALGAGQDAPFILVYGAEVQEYGVGPVDGNGFGGPTWKRVVANAYLIEPSGSGFTSTQILEEQSSSSPAASDVLVFTEPYEGAPARVILLGSGGVYFVDLTRKDATVPARLGEFSAPTEAARAVAADFSGDGLTDLLVVGQASSHFLIQEPGLRAQ